jgi:hypothetical protein
MSAHRVLRLSPHAPPLANHLLWPDPCAPLRVSMCGSLRLKFETYLCQYVCDCEVWDFLAIKILLYCWIWTHWHVYVQYPNGTLQVRARVRILTQLHLAGKGILPPSWNISHLRVQSFSLNIRHPKSFGKYSINSIKNLLNIALVN